MSVDLNIPVFFKCSSQDWLTICYLIDKRKKVFQKKLATIDETKKRSGRPFLPLPVLELMEVDNNTPDDNMCYFSCSALHYLALESLIKAHANVLASREKARKGGRKIVGPKHPVPVIQKIEAEIV